MENLKRQFQEETKLSFDDIPINGVHLEYINWLEKRIKALSLGDVVGSTVTEITTRELEPYEFHCSKCNTIHKKTAYAIAQHTMGVELIFTCACGNKIDL